MGMAALLDECWTLDDRRACVATLASLARNGSVEATKLLFNYAFGKPRELKEHSGSVSVTVVYEDQPIDDEAPR